MVGVPGRSKGCATCRRRKKGCDYQRPSCGQCLRAGIECEGYERQRVFILNTGNEGPTPRQSSSSPDKESPDKESKEESRQRRQQGVIARRPNPRTVVHKSFEQKNFEDITLGLFWSHYLPGGKAFSPDAAKMTTGSWTLAVEDLYWKDSVIKYPLLAMATAHLGRKHDDPVMESRALQLYGRGLTEIAQALDKPARAKSDAILGANRLLSMYTMMFGGSEANESVQGRNWNQHVLGDSAILQARSPRAHISGEGHQLFVDIRMFVILSAHTMRKKCFLSSPEWMTIPWQQIPKTPKDELLDIMVDIPEIAELQDQFRACPPSAFKESLRTSLIVRCRSLETQLLKWIERCGPLKDFDNPSPIDPTPEADLARGQLTLLYWSICINLYSMLRGITSVTSPGASSSSSASVSSPSSVASDLPIPDPREYARSILHNVPFFYQPGAGFFHVQHLTVPVGYALGAICNNPAGGILPEDAKLMEEFASTPQGRFMLAYMNSMVKAGSEVKKSPIGKKPAGMTEMGEKGKKEAGLEDYTANVRAWDKKD